MHPAFLYLPGDRLSVSELSAARIDGHVVEVGEGYIPADLVEGTDTRAGSLGVLVVAGFALVGPSAAWVHGAGSTPPPRHHLRRAVERRQRPRPDRRLIVHDARLPPEDLCLLAGVPVSTAARTMADLALSLHRDPAQLCWMRALAAVDAALVDEAIARLSALHRVPGTRLGLAALSRLKTRGQDEVTRYTS